MKISYSDIVKRISKLESPVSSSLANMREARIYTENKIFCKENAVNSIRNWESLDKDTDVAFNKALDIFEELCMNANESTIKESCRILTEAENKVRDQTQLMRSLKNRFARIKHKTEYNITKAHNTVTSNIYSSISNLQNTLKGASGGIAKANTVNVAKECFQELEDQCSLITECDRILRNYATISRRFNLDKVVSNIYRSSDSYQACFEIASYIDTYNQPFKNRYNSALEMTAYLFDKHFMNYPKEMIVEAVTDYFLFTGSLKEAQVNDVRDVMNISVLFEQDDFSSLSWLEMDPEPIENSVTIDLEDYGGEYGSIAEAIGFKKIIRDKKKEVKKDIKQTKKIIKRAAKEGNPEEHRDAEIKQMVDDFRSSCLKNKDSKTNLPSFKAMVSKIFTKSPYQIVYELPNILSLVRVVFVIGTGAIHPVLMLCSFIADQIIHIHLSRKQLEKIVKAYNSEIESVEAKIEKTKNDDDRENLEKYKEELEKDLEKIKSYENEMYSEEENDERLYGDNDFGDDDDFEFEDSEFDDIDFDEAAAIEILATQMNAISEALIDDSVEGVVFNNIFKLDNDCIDALTDFSITVPVVLEKDKLRDCLCSYRDEIRESAHTTKDYVRIDCLNENIYKLSNSGTSYITASSMKDAMHYLYCLNEIMKIKADNYIIEMDFTNSIKLAMKQLKNTAMKLPDKEKQLSSNIDVAANNTAKAIEKALMNGNREAVIRGSMIPSASKCIKTAIIAGAAWAINPAVAVIGAIGAFACSKKLQKKERQLILDDIDIELRMCERYMRQAEDEGDMKKVKQIETIERNLKRQKQRIQYKTVTIYSKQTPSVDTVTTGS